MEHCFLPPVRFVTQAYPWARARNRAGLAIACAAALAWILVRVRPFRVAVEGDSMSPVLEAGDFLVATRSGRMVRGSLVVVEHPGRPGYEMVKRVGAAPGDQVVGRELGRGEYWLLGDNPPQSTDSRTLGPMPVTGIRGVIRLRYWPPSRLRFFS
jgi:signal peptidase I